jgi:hypothetical protein
MFGIAAWPPALPDAAMCVCAAALVQGALRVGTPNSTSHHDAPHMLPLAAHVSLLILEGAGGVAPASFSGSVFHSPCQLVRHVAVTTKPLLAACVAGS